MKPSRRIGYAATALLGACLAWWAIDGWLEDRAPIRLPRIERHPAPLLRAVRPLNAVPRFDPNSGDAYQVDLRSRDVAALDLSKTGPDLAGASFDTATRWPSRERMPAEFDPATIMESGKNPGLGIRRLHAAGITGRGVGIAIIDQILPVDHPEYAGQLRLYEEADDIMWPWNDADMHGAAVASIAVGRNVGVAPEADLYYIATHMGAASPAAIWRRWREKTDLRSQIDFRVLADCVRRVLEIDRRLPPGQRIRVLCMATGWRADSRGADAITAAAAEARAAGMLVICSSVGQVHGFRFNGIGRNVCADPNVFESWEPGLFWAESFWRNPAEFIGQLFIPMDARTTAGYLQGADYAFSRVGGWSWSIPYIAGLYALAAQVKPEVTPEVFWAAALETGRTIELSRDDRRVPFGPIVDPRELLERLQTR